MTASQPEGDRVASVQNREVLHSFYDALNRDDVDAAVELCDDQVEVYLSPEVVAAVAPRGRRDVAGYLRGWIESWHDYSPQPEQFFEAGDQVVVMVQLRARGKGSRFEIEEPMADVYTLENGKIARLRFYVDRDTALRSAGISP
jgi:ketosteroid isomerase-like protein